MTVLFPEATPVLGNLKVLVLDALASLAAPDLSSEIGGAGTLDISCFIRNWSPDFTTNTGSAPNRMCTTVVLPQEGQTQAGAISIAYPYDPQAATSTTDNKARLKLARGAELFAVVRKGLPYTTAMGVDDYTEAIKFRCGRQNYVQSGDDEFAEFEIQQMLFPLQAEPTFGQVVA